MFCSGQSPLTADSEDLYDEAHWSDQVQGSQGAKPAAGGPVSAGPSEVVPQATLRLKKIPPGKILSLDQAIHFSIDCACETFTHIRAIRAYSSITVQSNTHTLVTLSPSFSGH